MDSALELFGALTTRRSFDLAFSAINAIAWPPLEGPMAAKAHIVHHIPGRVRLRVPARRRDRHYFNQVKSRLESIPSIHAVEINPASASVLVRYAGPLASLLAEVAAAGLHELADISTDLPPVPPVTERLIERLLDLDQKITESSGGSLNGRAVVLIGLLLAAGVQFYRGQFFGPAVTLIWYAATGLGVILPRQAGQPAPPGREACVPAPAG